MGIRKNQYIRDDRGNVIETIGAAQLKHVFSRREDGTVQRTVVDIGGRMIEETMNTNMEEESLKRYLNINEEQLEDLYKQGVLRKSAYQELASPMMGAVLRRGPGLEFERYRMFGNKSDYR